MRKEEGGAGRKEAGTKLFTPTYLLPPASGKAARRTYGTRTARGKHPSPRCHSISIHYNPIIMVQLLKSFPCTHGFFQLVTVCVALASSLLESIGPHNVSVIC